MAQKAEESCFRDVSVQMDGSMKHVAGLGLLEEC